MIFRLGIPFKKFFYIIYRISITNLVITIRKAIMCTIAYVFRLYLSLQSVKLFSQKALGTIVFYLFLVNPLGHKNPLLLNDAGG